jgi:hypothetical protein
VLLTMMTEGNAGDDDEEERGPPLPSILMANVYSLEEKIDQGFNCRGSYVPLLTETMHSTLLFNVSFW